MSLSKVKENELRERKTYNTNTADRHTASLYHFLDVLSTPNSAVRVASPLHPHTLTPFLPRSIKSIPPLAFMDLHSLEWLKLSHNDLTRLTEDTVQPILDTLTMIDVSRKSQHGGREGGSERDRTGRGGIDKGVGRGLKSPADFKNL